MTTKVNKEVNVFSKGKYKHYDIIACWGKWFIIYDGSYNWILYQWCNDTKPIKEFYSNFDNALRIGLIPKIIKGCK